MFNENPVLSSDVFNERSSESMTVFGTATKILLSLCVIFATGIYTYNLTMQQLSGIEVVKNAGHLARFTSLPSNVSSFIVFGGLAAFVVGLIITFVPNTASYLTLVYAGLEGFALGGITGLYQVAYGNSIAIQSLLGVFAICSIAWILYATQIIKVTNTFVSVVLVGMITLIIVYFADIILSMFGIRVPIINETGVLGICFSIIVALLSSAMLIIDFKNIDELVESKAPKNLEWYAAFGLILTIVWMYLEILKLLAKIKSNDD